VNRFELLITNGCSYTRGAELADPKRESWPARLAERLDAQVVNIASDGGSNRRIVRTTVSNVDAICRRRGVSPGSALVMCMWTGLARNEHHRKVRRDNGNRPDLPHETHWHRLGRWRIDEGDEASENYFRWVWSEHGAAVDLAVDWAVMNDSLTSRGFTVRYTYAWDILPSKIPAEAAGLLSTIAPTTTYGGVPPAPGSSFYELVKDRYAVGRLRHPLRDAHSFYADLLFAWLSQDHAN
jgi:hypothetical protein